MYVALVNVSNVLVLQTVVFVSIRIYYQPQMFVNYVVYQSSDAHDVLAQLNVLNVILLMVSHTQTSNASVQ